MKPRGLEAAARTVLTALVLLASGCDVGQLPRAPAAPPNAPTPSATSVSERATVDIAPAPMPAGWKTYTDPSFGITLQYPPDWQPKQGYDQRYAGKDGFFQVSAMDSDATTIDLAAAAQAFHKLRPYGTDPKVESLEIQGQQARMILPSVDQPTEEEGLAALIVLAPHPIEISGARHRYLVLYSDKNHIFDITRTLRFTATAIRPATTPESRASPPDSAARLNGPPSVPVSTRYEAPALIADIVLERQIRELLGAEVTSYGVMVKRLADGRGVQINPDRQFYAASLYKLLVMYEVFKQRQLGLLDFDEKLSVTPWYLQFQLFRPPWPDGAAVPIRELLEAMIKESDNVAAMLLHDRVGGWNIIQDLRAIGLAHTDIAGDDMPTSAKDMALWLEMIAAGKAVDQQSSREMIDLLSRQAVRDRLPALLPASTKVANKTGNWKNATHDVGVVYAPKGAYVIAVLSDRAGQSKPIAELSRLVYEYLERHVGVPAPLANPSQTPPTRPTAISTPRISVSPTPSTISLKVYFTSVANNKVEFVPLVRTVPRTQAMARAAIEELLRGPTQEEKAGAVSSPIPEGVKLRSLKIVDGVAYADFDKALQFQVVGSARVAAIRKCIAETLLQFSTVKNVIISIEGRTQDILQP